MSKDTMLEKAARHLDDTFPSAMNKGAWARVLAGFAAQAVREREVEIADELERMFQRSKQSVLSDGLGFPGDLLAFVAQLQSEK